MMKERIEVPEQQKKLVTCEKFLKSNPTLTLKERVQLKAQSVNDLSLYGSNIKLLYTEKCIKYKKALYLYFIH